MIKPLLLLILIFITACSKDEIPSICTIDLEPDDTYAYPLVPGTPEWANLKSGDERFDATQIPKRVAMSMSTDGLIESWMTYPLNFELNLGNSYPETLQFFKDKFNGLKELITRFDSGCKMLERYRAMDLNNLPQPWDHLALVVLVCDFDVLKFMTNEHYQTLITHALNNHEIQLLYPKHYSIPSISFSLWICARTMLYLDYQPFLVDIEKSEDLWLFVETGHLQSYLGYDSFELQSVIKHAKKFKI